MAGAPTKVYSYSVEDILKIAKMERAAYFSHVSRGTIKPDNLASVVQWLAIHAPPAFRIKLVSGAIYADVKPKLKARKPGAKKKALRDAKASETQSLRRDLVE